LSAEECQEAAESSAAELKIQQAERSKLCRRLVQLRNAQSEASRHHKSEKSKDSYCFLQKARSATRELYREVALREECIRQIRQDLYYWNSIHKASKAVQRKPKAETTSNDPKAFTKVTWRHFNVEDSTDFLDISKLSLNCRKRNRRVVFTGTDYGVCKMSVTVAQTHGEIEEHINRYNVLCKLISRGLVARNIM
jgi:hypothetical protein